MVSGLEDTISDRYLISTDEWVMDHTTSLRSTQFIVFCRRHVLENRFTAGLRPEI